MQPRGFGMPAMRAAIFAGPFGNSWYSSLIETPEVLPSARTVGRGSADYPIPWRRSPWCVHPFGLWEDPADDERGKRWARDMRADLQPWASGAVLLNFIGDEGQDRVVASLGRENYERLATIKARYDPDNVFHVNHNIAPSGAGWGGLPGG